MFFGMNQKLKKEIVMVFQESKNKTQFIMKKVKCGKADIQNLF